MRNKNLNSNWVRDRGGLRPPIPEMATTERLQTLQNVYKSDTYVESIHFETQYQISSNLVEKWYSNTRFSLLDK